MVDRIDDLCDIIISFEDEVKKYEDTLSSHTMKDILRVRNSALLKDLIKSNEEQRSFLANLTKKRVEKMNTFATSLIESDRMKVEIDQDGLMTMTISASRFLDSPNSTSGSIRSSVSAVITELRETLKAVDLPRGDISPLGKLDNRIQEARISLDAGIQTLAAQKQTIDRTTIDLLERLSQEVDTFRNSPPKEVADATREFAEIVSDYNLYSAKGCQMCGQKLFMSKSPHHRGSIASHAEDLFGYSCQ